MRLQRVSVLQEELGLGEPLFGVTRLLRCWLSQSQARALLSGPALEWLRSPRDRRVERGAARARRALGAQVRTTGRVQGQDPQEAKPMELSRVRAGTQCKGREWLSVSLTDDTRLPIITSNKRVAKLRPGCTLRPRASARLADPQGSEHLGARALAAGLAAAATPFICF